LQGVVTAAVSKEFTWKGEKQAEAALSAEGEKQAETVKEAVERNLRMRESELAGVAAKEPDAEQVSLPGPSGSPPGTPPAIPRLCPPPKSPVFAGDLLSGEPTPRLESNVWRLLDDLELSDPFAASSDSPLKLPELSSMVLMRAGGRAGPYTSGSRSATSIAPLTSTEQGIAAAIATPLSEMPDQTDSAEAPSLLDFGSFQGPELEFGSFAGVSSEQPVSPPKDRDPCVVDLSKLLAQGPGGQAPAGTPGALYSSWL